jgi:Family of unknown function (DUF5946)
MIIAVQPSVAGGAVAKLSRERTTLCRGCGAAVPDVSGETHAYILAAPGCWAAYCEVLAREYADRAYFTAHRWTVDTYAVQHPGVPDRRSIQSVNAHLVALHLTLDRALGAAFAGRVIGIVTNRFARDLVWLQPPPPCPITIMDVIGAESAAAHGTAVERWARAVWRSWTPQHGAVKALADRVMAEL